MSASDVASDDPIKLGHRGIGFLLNQAARALSADMDKELRLQGLDHASLVLLRNTLRECDYAVGSLNASVLAVRLILPPDVVTTGAEKLAHEGWLDVRGTGSMMTLRPTKKSLDMLVVLLDKTRWTFNRALNGFTHEEIETLTGMLQRVIRNFDAYAGPDDR